LKVYVISMLATGARSSGISRYLVMGGKKLGKFIAGGKGKYCGGRQDLITRQCYGEKWGESGILLKSVGS